MRDQLQFLTMSILEQVVHLNAHGVNCMTSPLTPQVQNEAFTSFKSALTILSSACANPRVPPPESPEAPLHVVIRASPFFTSTQSERQAFHMISQETADSYEAFTASSAVVMFNMALGLHRRGFSSKNIATLKRACCLYEHCLQLLSIVANRFGGAEVLTSEALKNLADVYCQLGNYSSLRCVLDSLTLMDVRNILLQAEQVSHGRAKVASAA